MGASKAKLDLDRVPAANIRRLRDDRLWTQEELARRAGLDRTEVQKIETGNRNPGVEVLLKLAGALEVTPDEILRGASWNSEENTFTYEDPDANGSPS
ncbi:MAG TPA: helix-turn-helix transcriptional regulator [Solirubrobacterales bacterium]